MWNIYKISAASDFCSEAALIYEIRLDFIFIR